MGVISDDRPSREDLQEEQFRNQEEIHNLSAADQPDRVDPDYVELMIDSELDEGTLKMLSNMLSPDWVLSQLSEAEVHEARWLARVIADEVIDLHPAEDSIWKGELRKYASDNPMQNLRPLNSAQKSELHQLIQGYIARVARSREGFQQEMFKKQIRKSEREDRSDDEESGWI